MRRKIGLAFVSILFFVLPTLGATVTWRGDAVAVKQVSTVQITAFDAATTYRITINGKIVSVPGNTSVNQTATDLEAALEASTAPEFLEIDFTVATDTVTFTAVTAGVPFTATSSVTGGGGTIGAFTTTTASAGPLHWDTAGNWSGGAVPGADDIIFENTSKSVLYGLSQTTVAPTSITIRSTFTGTIGLPRVSASGYVEYRVRYLSIDVTTLNIGDAAGGTGSGRIMVDTDTATSVINVYSTGTSLETGLGAFILKGTAATTLNVFRGSVSIAPFAGESASVATGFKLGLVQGAANSVATVYCGSGVTFGTVSQDGGTLTTHSAITTNVQTGGEHTHEAGAITTCTMRGNGTKYYKSTSTITTLVISSTAILDFSRDNRVRTVSAATAYKGCTIRDPGNFVVWTAGIDLGEGTKLSDVTLDVGSATIKVNP